MLFYHLLWYVCCTGVDVGGAKKQHKDRGDDPATGAIIASVSAAAVVVLDGIKCRVLLEPGDLLYLKGDLIPHYVEEWSGERYSLVYFADRNVFTTL